MARFGYLYLNYGRWGDKQILPADWVAKTPPRSKSVMGYGYLFWNYTVEPFAGFYEANGANGQYIVIQPSRDMVIVRTANIGPLDGFVAQIGHWLGIQ
jgi:CubicO group peptidase (beta-lactamase class C family)